MDRFRFNSPPFTREINVEHRLKVPHIEEQIVDIKKTIDDRQSAVLVAPAGAGKTLALRTLRSQLPEARYSTAYIKLSNLSARDMCREVARALGVTPVGHFPGLVQAVEDKLRSGFIEGGRRQVVIFDDAQDMREEALRLVRLITNFEMDSRLVVSVILSGQGALKPMLLRDEMVDIHHRMAHCGELSLLTREETRSYVEHRSTIAGASPAPFEPQAVEAIHEISRGNMRAIDKVARAALVEADRASKNRVDAGDVALARTRTWT